MGNSSTNSLNPSTTSKVLRRDNRPRVHAPLAESSPARGIAQCLRAEMRKGKLGNARLIPDNIGASIIRLGF